MKVNALFAGLLAVSVLIVTSTEASGASRRARVIKIVQPQPQQVAAARKTTAAPAAQPPAVVTKKFKELAVNDEYYLATDTQKSFAKVKLSANSARTVKTGEVSSPIPEDTLVVPAKATATPAAKKAGKAGKTGKTQ